MWQGMWRLVSGLKLFGYNLYIIILIFSHRTSVKTCYFTETSAVVWLERGSNDGGNVDGDSGVCVQERERE